jgi:hypothetical protein
MVDNLANMMNREWNLTNNDADDNPSNRHSWRSRLLTRKISDNNNHRPSTNDYSERSTIAVTRAPKPLSDRRSLDTTYDTDGGMGTAGNTLKHHHISSNNNYEHLVSPRLPKRRTTTQPSKQLAAVPLQHRLSQKLHLTATPSLSTAQSLDDRDEEELFENVARRPRLSRRGQQPPLSNGTHAARVLRSPALPRHGGPLPATPSVQPLRIIFMRHSERVNQALGPDWFIKAFSSRTYKSYDPNLPVILPKRRFDQAYEFDVPLTGEKLDLLFCDILTTHMIYFSSWIESGSSYWPWYDE